MRISLLLSFMSALLLIGGCSSGSDDSGGDITDAGTETAADGATDQDEAASDADQGTPDHAADVPAESTDDATAATPAIGGGTATLTLDNGLSYSFSVLCTLEPQEAAGSEILFTLVSYDDPVNLDVTQFGADSFDGAAGISLYDSTTYDTLWEANEIFGNEVELTLTGSTVTGTGMFREGDGSSGEAVAGELVANC
jgi:hypothetical protein